MCFQSFWRLSLNVINVVNVIYVVKFIRDDTISDERNSDYHISSFMTTLFEQSWKVSEVDVQNFFRCARMFEEHIFAFECLILSVVQNRSSRFLNVFQTWCSNNGRFLVVYHLFSKTIHFSYMNSLCFKVHQQRSSQLHS